MVRIDLNADAGEGFGRWTLGDDEALFPHITSVNAACAWHGGDPRWMRNSVKLAKQHSVALGAHPGFPDLLGFGRRRILATHEEVVDMCVYQVGAMLAFAKAEGVRLAHVKPHGELNVHIMNDEELLLKVARAMVQLQPDLDFIIQAGGPTEVLRKCGLKARAELVADLEYDDEGHVIIEKVTPAKDPAYVARRGVQMASGILETVGGLKRKIMPDTLCIHGDRPGAAENAKALVAALTKAGFEVAAPVDGSPVRVA